MNIYDSIGLMKPNNFAIFDLDGCLVDDEWRLPLIKEEGHPNRWDEYHSVLGQDKALDIGRLKLLDCIDQGLGILIITARPEYTRDQTVMSLRELFPELINHGYFLFMRDNGDGLTSSPALKTDIVNNIKFSLRDRQRITLAFDDRRDVCKAYHLLGIRAQILDKNGCSDFAPDMHENIPADAVITNVRFVDSPKIEKPDAEGSFERCAKYPDIEVESDPFLGTKPFIKPTRLDDVDLPEPKNAADILQGAADTFRARNAVYKDNADNVGKVMAALFPDGVQLKTANDHKMYHLFELIIVKLTRFANSGLKHNDSIHDMAVYAAMCEVLTDKHDIKFESLDPK